MIEAKKFIYAKRFNGLPKISDFKLESEILPALNDGGKDQTKRIKNHSRSLISCIFLFLFRCSRGSIIFEC